MFCNTTAGINNVRVFLGKNIRKWAQKNVVNSNSNNSKQLIIETTP